MARTISEFPLFNPPYRAGGVLLIEVRDRVARKEVAADAESEDAAHESEKVVRGGWDDEAGRAGTTPNTYSTFCTCSRGARLTI